MSVVRLQRHGLWLVIGCTMIAAVIWLSLTPDPVTFPAFNLSDKLAHLLAYALLMGWFGQLYERPMLRLGYAFSFILLGVVLEFAQGMSGQRSFEIADMIANAGGVIIAWIALRRGADRLLIGFEQRVMGLKPSVGEPHESP